MWPFLSLYFYDIQQELKDVDRKLQQLNEKVLNYQYENLPKEIRITDKKDHLDCARHQKQLKEILLKKMCVKTST